MNFSHPFNLILSPNRSEKLLNDCEGSSVKVKLWRNTNFRVNNLNNMSFICNKNTVRITWCIIYTGNKAKANVDKFYSLPLFCFWIKKKSSNELFFNIVKFAWGLFHFCFKEKRKKNQYFSISSFIPVSKSLQCFTFGVIHFLPKFQSTYWSKVSSDFKNV